MAKAIHNQDHLCSLVGCLAVSTSAACCARSTAICCGSVRFALSLRIMLGQDISAVRRCVVRRERREEENAGGRKILGCSICDLGGTPTQPNFSWFVIGRRPTQMLGDACGCVDSHIKAAAWIHMADMRGADAGWYAISCSRTQCFLFRGSEQWWSSMPDPAFFLRLRR